jgi:hypothetical protein
MSRTKEAQKSSRRDTDKESGRKREKQHRRGTKSRAEGTTGIV